jgi:hypothetical protein
LSRLLIDQGISPVRVERWRQDGLWLSRFLKRLEGKLLVLAAQAPPGHHPRVLTLRYGLDGTATLSAAGVANELGITTVEAQLAHDLLLRYLHRAEGRAALERAVLTAAKESERNDERKR